MERGLFGVFIRVRILSPGADGHGESVLCGPAGPDRIGSIGGSALLRIEVRKKYFMKKIIRHFCFLQNVREFKSSLLLHRTQEKLDSENETLGQEDVIHLLLLLLPLLLQHHRHRLNLGSTISRAKNVIHYCAAINAPPLSPPRRSEEKGVQTCPVS